MINYPFTIQKLLFQDSVRPGVIPKYELESDRKYAALFLDSNKKIALAISSNYVAVPLMEISDDELSGLIIEALKRPRVIELENFDNLEKEAEEALFEYDLWPMQILSSLHHPSIAADEILALADPEFLGVCATERDTGKRGFAITNGAGTVLFKLRS